MTIAACRSITAQYGLNIDHIDRLSGQSRRTRQRASRARAASSSSVRGRAGRSSGLVCRNSERLESNVDIAFQKTRLFRRNRRLACSTWTDADRSRSHRRTGQAAGSEQVSKLPSVRWLVSWISSQLLRAPGAAQRPRRQRADSSAPSLRLTEGAGNPVRRTCRLGYKTAILSGGFTYFCQAMQPSWYRLCVRQIC